MAGRSRSALLLTSVFITVACGLDTGTDPTSAPPPEAKASLTMTADSVNLLEGGDAKIGAVVRNKQGYPMLPTPAIVYSTSSGSVATVSDGGIVSAVKPGSAVISAKAIVGDLTLTDSAIVIVRRADVNDHLELVARAKGWDPTPAHVVSGGYVKWLGGVIEASGVPVSTVYVWNSATPAVIDTLDLTLTGSAMRSFAVPGKYYYCSNACWDTPEWGTIVVH